MQHFINVHVIGNQSLIIVIANGLLINNCSIKGDEKKGGSKAEKGKQYNKRCPCTPSDFTRF
jgi:hypothetical protein